MACIVQSDVFARFWWEYLRDRVHMEDLCVDRIILKWISYKQSWRAWTGFIWLRTGRSGGILRTQRLWVPQNSGNHPLLKIHSAPWT